MNASTKKRQPQLKSLDELKICANTMSIQTITDKPGGVGNTYDSEFAIVPFDLMDDYPDHPFRLYDGERKSDMIESLRNHGILQDLILRPTENGRFHILSGHNRKYNGIEAGLTEAPSKIKHGIGDEEAWIYVVETNLMQRSFSDMLHSEKATVIALHHSKLFSQGKRNDIIAELEMLENPHISKAQATYAQVEHRLKSRDIVAKEYSLSKDTVARYLRINKLTSSLKEKLDTGIFAFIPAVTLSFLKGYEQESLNKCIDLNNFTVDMKKAETLRQYSEKGGLDDDSIYLILSGEIGQKTKPNRTPTVKVSKSTYSKYFQPSMSAKDVQNIVEKALEMYFDKQEDIA